MSTSRSRIRLLAVTFAIALAAAIAYSVFASSGRLDAKRQLCASISNDDVTATVSWAGSRWKFGGVSQAIADSHDPAYVPQLLELLTDEQRYIAAHFLLVELTTEPGEVIDDKLELLPFAVDQGGTRFLPLNRLELQRQWTAVLAAPKKRTRFSEAEGH